MSSRGAAIALNMLRPSKTAAAASTRCTRFRKGSRGDGPRCRARGTPFRFTLMGSAPANARPIALGDVGSIPRDQLGRMARDYNLPLVPLDALEAVAREFGASVSLESRPADELFLLEALARAVLRRERCWSGHAIWTPTTTPSAKQCSRGLLRITGPAASGQCWRSRACRRKRVPNRVPNWADLSRTEMTSQDLRAL